MNGEETRQSDAEVEHNVSGELSLMEEQKNCTDGDDLYAQTVENMQAYYENLLEFYNEMLVMRLETVKTKLDYVQCQQELDSIDSNITESSCSEAEAIQVPSESVSI